MNKKYIRKLVKVDSYIRKIIPLPRFGPYAYSKSFIFRLIKCLEFWIDIIRRLIKHV